MELLRGIAASLKGIHSSLESLTAAVEDVSESIEKAHEPEGDLGTHLVGALKDLVSALHKRAQQERSHQPQQNHQRQQQQGRRPEQRRQTPPTQHDADHGAGNAVDQEGDGSVVDHPMEAGDISSAQEKGEQPPKKSGRGRSRRGGRPSNQAAKE